jgi:hypothetical protein
MVWSQQAGDWDGVQYVSSTLTAAKSYAGAHVPATFESQAMARMLNLYSTEISLTPRGCWIPGRKRRLKVFTVGN